MITQERLKELVSYDPETGEFTNLVTRGQIKAGCRPGYVRIQDGYYVMILDGRLYLGHTVAWIYMLGTLPPDEIDHRDLDKSNNRWSNLRAATPRQNCANRRKRADSKQPYKCVTFHRKKWRYAVVVDGKRQWSKVFDTPELAHAAYAKKAVEIHGEFARVL